LGDHNALNLTPRGSLESKLYENKTFSFKTIDMQMPYMITILTSVKEIACIYACPLQTTTRGLLKT
jgi:hypothetical protein